MDEFGFIRELMAPLAAGAPGAYGLGDDAAIIAASPGHELVVTADALTAGVHFKPEDPPDLIARKALRVNLSDLAAKGAHPVGFLLTLALPRATSDAWLKTFVAGLGADVREFHIPVLGGDTTTTPGPLTLSITAIGEVPTGQMIRRSGAKAGDLLCVSGTIGDAALGLTSSDPYLIGRYRVPQPRLSLGQALRGHASAALDVSDGLVADVGHICTQSGIGAIIEIDRVPLSEPVQQALRGAPGLIETILSGGDDYEIAFTIPASEQSYLRSLHDPEVTVIGRCETGSRLRVLERGGIEYSLRSEGYRHF